MIRYSKEFKYELDEAMKNDYCLSPSIKSDFQKEFIQKLKYIQMFPKMYPRLLQNPIYRKMPIRNYLILYIVREKEIIFMHIIHQKSKLLNNQD